MDVGWKNYHLHLGNSPEEQRLISSLRSLPFAGNVTISSKSSLQRQLRVVLTPTREPGCLGWTPGLQPDVEQSTDRTSWLSAKDLMSEETYGRVFGIGQGIYYKYIYIWFTSIMFCPKLSGGGGRSAPWWPGREISNSQKTTVKFLGVYQRNWSAVQCFSELN